MLNYLESLEEVLYKGEEREDRTGTGTYSIFGDTQLRFNLQRGFPVVTTKKLHFDSVKAELLWFLMGDQSIKPLQDMGCHIWDANVYSDYWDNNPHKRFKDDAGRIYGVQWRNWFVKDKGLTYKTIDQIQEVITSIKENPYSRRHIVTAWNPGELEYMSLPPCHILFQFYVHEQGGLSLKMYQRSADAFLGVPFNIASYALLLTLVARITGHSPKYLYITFGDYHIYKNHVEQVKTQINRMPYDLPDLWVNDEIKDIDNFTMDDIKLINYQYHPAIKAEMAV